MSKVGTALRYGGLCLLLMVMLVGPFYRGLFFAYEMLIGITAVAGGFALWALGRRLGRLPVGLPGGGAGLALLALLLCDLLLMPVAVYTRGNLDWLLRTAGAWFAFVMLRAEARPGTRRLVGWALLLGAAGVALAGLLEFVGYAPGNATLAAALSQVALHDRLYSAYQYPNTAAAIFLMAVWTAVGLALDGEPKPLKLAPLGALAGLVSLACFFTLSRGAVLVLPIGLLLLLVGFDRQRLWRGALLLMAMMAAPVLVGMHGVAAQATAHQWQKALPSIVLAALAAGLWSGALGILLRLRPRLQATLVGAALLGGAGLLAIWRPALPAMATRLFDINLKTTNVVVRLHYYRDALQIIADHPLGLGGAGWSRTYPQYQVYNYFATETHNHYAQTAIEAGVPGLIALLAAIGLALWTAVRGRRDDPLRWALAAGAATIAAHTLIDFDLSYFTVWLILWSLLAAVCDPPDAREQPMQGVVAVAIGLGVACLAARLAIGAGYLYEATRLFDAGDEPSMMRTAAIARRLDPWNSETLLLIDTVESLRAALRHDASNAEIWHRLAVRSEVAKDYTGAYEAAKQALALQPALVDHYNAFARLAGFKVNAALAAGDQTTARALAKELVAAGQQLTNRQQIAAPFQRYWPAGEKLEWSNLMRLHIGKGYFLTGDFRTAEAYLKQASEEWNYASDGEVWLYALYEKEGRQAEMKALEQKPWVRFRNVNKTYQALRTWQRADQG